MIDTIKIQPGGQKTMNENIRPVQVKTLAPATAALQRLNCRISMLDPYAKNAFFQSKLRLSEILCRQGFCTWREIQHRAAGESLCKMYFRLGSQSYSWAVPLRRLHFEVTIKDPPTSYEGELADETKVAVMDDRELMVTVVNLGNPPPSRTKPESAPVQNSEEQQLALLKAFHDENGRWPSSADEYPAGNALGKQAIQWRNRYKNGSLDWHTVRHLNGMGFPWDAKSSDWFGRFFHTYEFLKANSRWPSYPSGATEEENELAKWLCGQAGNYQSGLLSPQKKWLLDSLNFDWGGYSRCQKRYKTVR